MTRTSDADAYARVVLERVQHSIATRDGIATTAQLERMREAYSQLHRDTPALCARRRREI